MAKGETKKSPVHVSKSIKTAKQREQAEINAQVAAERLTRLQERQKLANAYRVKYPVLKGKLTDEQVIVKANQIAANVIAAEWNNVVLNQTGETGDLIRRWLADRVNNEPTHVQFLIRKFLKRGRNAIMARIVDQTFVKTSVPVAA